MNEITSDNISTNFKGYERKILALNGTTSGARKLIKTKVEYHNNFPENFKQTALIEAKNDLRVINCTALQFRLANDFLF